MKRLIILLAFMPLFSSCKEDPISTERKGNFTLQLLFEHEGCKVYRFKDGTRYIYWSDCRGNSNYETGGKHSTTVESITN